MDRKCTHWIWYPGDFEIYQGLLQNISREERSFGWPAYWGLSDCRKNVRFSRDYQLKKPEEVTIFSYSTGYFSVNGVKYPFGNKAKCPAGEVRIEAYAATANGLPAIYVQGKTIFSDESWLATDFYTREVPAGCNCIYTKRKQNPSVWEYSTKLYKPCQVQEKQGGTLYEFETELTAQLKITWVGAPKKVLLCYGESETEALDTNQCYYSQVITEKTRQTVRRAFRYLFCPDIKPGEMEITAVHQFVDYPHLATFHCNEEKINQIWQVAEETFRLCSGVFFIDGAKRDKWIWSGDAYQSYFINRYLFFDEGINQRTIWALRGNDPVQQHINTIVDYSLYWIISIEKHYEMTGDAAFVRSIYPRMCTMMAFLERQLDENGFLTGRKGDWTFIDWAEIDKDGPVCAIQILLAECYKAMEYCAEMCAAAEKKQQEILFYREKRETLVKQIEQMYWDCEKNAYIDSFSSGKRHISRHTNLFAILFGIATEQHSHLIYQYVLENPAVPPITTPYFKFFELEGMCYMGKYSEVKDKIQAYWGGMLDQGAKTFWEEFDPAKKGTEQYAMYGDPYGKSLCHAWAGSPIYLIGRYFMGLTPTRPGYQTFLVEPQISTFDNFDAKFPIKDGTVAIKWDGQKLTVCTDRQGGTLRCFGQEIQLEPHENCVLAANKI